MKVSISSALLLAFAAAAIGCAKTPESQNLADGQKDAILKSKNLEDSYIFRNSDTNEIVETEKDGAGFSQKYTYLTGSPIKWGGTIKWWYNPNGQPSYMTTNDAVKAMVAATQQWSAVCGVTFAYQGLTTNTVTMSGCNGATVVGWGPLSGSTVGQTQACFGSTNTFNEFDMTLDNEQPLQITSVSMLQEVAIHEFGHAFGLGHTDVSPAVMTAFLTTANPVSDDIAGCQSLYGPPPTSSTPTTTTTTMAPTTTTTVPSSTGWTNCAKEGGTCSFSGTRNVRYGANGSYVTKAFTGSVSCSNSVFGDPAVGVAKACDYSNSTVTTTSTTTSTTTTLAPTTTTTVPNSASWVRCANEWGTCSFSGTRTVRYGANGSYVTKVATGSIACTNDAFGSDPAYGTAKACDYSSTTSTSPTTATYKVRTRVNNAYCADDPGTNNGTQLHLWQCLSGISNQSLTFTSAGEIRVNGKCVDASQGRSGDPIVVWDCTGSANQKWTYNSSTGEIKGVNGLCFDAWGGQATNGTNIGLWTCNGGSNQKWDLTTP